MTNIQFIVVGWHFESFPETVQKLYKLKEEVEQVDVFWIMHKPPTDFIRSNFKYKEFENLGLERGAYQRALDYLSLDEDTVVFLIHDDLEIKSFEFINDCIERISRGVAFIGNGVNYPAVLDPFEVIWKGKTFKELVKQEYQHIFTEKKLVKTIRGSFMCTLVKYMNMVGGYEFIDNNPEDLRHIGGFGNTQQSLFGYKIHSLFGPERIEYLSNTYMDSEYIQEYARGIKE